MSQDLPPVGARVRVSDVREGVVTGHSPGVGTFCLDGGSQWFAPDPHPGALVRTIEVLELPRPDEPTGVNAVVLARHKYTHSDVARIPFTRARDGSGWYGQGDQVDMAWADLKDITVLHPGGVE